MIIILRDDTFLDAFSFLMSVCPSVRPSVGMEELNSHWTEFHEI